MPDCNSVNGLVGSMVLIRTLVKTAPGGLSRLTVSPVPGDQPKHFDGDLLVSQALSRWV